MKAGVPGHCVAAVLPVARRRAHDAESRRRQSLSSVTDVHFDINKLYSPPTNCYKILPPIVYNIIFLQLPSIANSLLPSEDTIITTNNEANGLPSPKSTPDFRGEVISIEMHTLNTLGIRTARTSASKAAHLFFLVCEGLLLFLEQDLQPIS